MFLPRTAIVLGLLLPLGGKLPAQEVRRDPGFPGLHVAKLRFASSGAPSGGSPMAFSAQGFAGANVVLPTAKPASKAPPKRPLPSGTPLTVEEITALFEANNDAPPAAVAPAAPRTPGLRAQGTPFTHWLDFNRLAANRWIPGNLPDWLDPVTCETVADEMGATMTIFRLRFWGIRDAGRGIQLRLFYDDRREVAPTVHAWSDAGAQRFTSGPLGAGLGLPSSETLTFPTAGVDRIEIRVPGDGRTVRGVFLAILAAQQTQHAVDFDVPADVVDAFRNVPPIVTEADDQSLFGRVRAMIDPGGLRLTPQADIRGAWEFPLESPPLLAVVTFEVLNADSLAPLEVILNDRPIGPASVHWPDLADPGYLGLARPLEKDMRFRYTGWLRCQKVIPGSALRTGTNALVLQLHPDSGPLAIRAVELNLKYNWKSLDYNLAPSSP